MEAFYSTFISVFLVEITDKTRILALVLGSRYRAPFRLMAGMTLGYVPAIAIAVAGAGLIGTVIPEKIYKAVIAVFFFAAAAYFLFSKEEKEEADEASGKFAGLGPFWAGFLLTALAELADKSQLMTASMMIKYNAAVAVFSGSLAAQAVLNIIYIAFGSWIGEKMPVRLLKKGAGVVFLFFGIAALL